jgi:hypothetical protein
MTNNIGRNECKTFKNVHPGTPLKVELPITDFNEKLTIEVSGSGFLKYSIVASKDDLTEFVGFVYHGTYRVDLSDNYAGCWKPSRTLIVENREVSAPMDVYVRVTCGR